MKPGVTTSPSASIVRFAAPSTRPTAATRPFRIPTSAVNDGIPVPSTTRPPFTTRSNILLPMAPASRNGPADLGARLHGAPRATTVADGRPRRGSGREANERPALLDDRLAHDRAVLEPERGQRSAPGGAAVEADGVRVDP